MDDKRWLHYFILFSISVALAGWLQILITIEWSYPYCLDQSDGPGYIIQGMPLPYWRWSGASSLDYIYLPHIYIVNLIILAVLFFPLVSWVLNIKIFQVLMAKIYLAVFGGLLFTTYLVVGTGMHTFYRPVSSLGLEGYYKYMDFRPVKLGYLQTPGTHCTPSAFWFPEGWKSSK